MSAAQWDDEDDGPDLDSDRREIGTQFTTVKEAIAARQAGESIEWIGSPDDAARMRHRLVLTDGLPVIEQAVFLDGAIERAVLCAYIQAPDAQQPVVRDGILAALDDVNAAVRPVLEREIRQTNRSYTAVVPAAFAEEPELHGWDIPVFGWRIWHPISPGADWSQSWDDSLDIALWNTAFTMAGYIGTYDQIAETTEAGFARLLRSHSVPAPRCVQCGQPITNQHPLWVGTWTTPDEEQGPLCEKASDVSAMADSRFRVAQLSEFGGPHQPDDA